MSSSIPQASVMKPPAWLVLAIPICDLGCALSKHQPPAAERVHTATRPTPPAFRLLLRLCERFSSLQAAVGKLITTCAIAPASNAKISASWLGSPLAISCCPKLRI
ncbi:hypothetical protein BC567DRAFT_220551 [Phyllosticta citribraziliensis]